MPISCRSSRRWRSSRDFADRFETGVTRRRAARAWRMRRASSTRSSTARPIATRPTSAHRAFATKAGIHASAIVKDPRPTSTSRPKASATGAGSWCPTRPASRTCWRNSTRAASTVDKDDPAARRSCSTMVKEREAHGYAYEAAEASFELLARAHARQRAAILRGRELPTSRSSAASTPSASWSPCRGGGEGQGRRRDV